MRLVITLGLSCLFAIRTVVVRGVWISVPLSDEPIETLATNSFVNLQHYLTFVHIDALKPDRNPQAETLEFDKGNNSL